MRGNSSRDSYFVRMISERSQGFRSFREPRNFVLCYCDRLPWNTALNYIPERGIFWNQDEAPKGIPKYWFGKTPILPIPAHSLIAIPALQRQDNPSGTLLIFPRAIYGRKFYANGVRPWLSGRSLAALEQVCLAAAVGQFPLLWGEAKPRTSKKRWQIAALEISTRGGDLPIVFAWPKIHVLRGRRG